MKILPTTFESIFEMICRKYDVSKEDIRIGFWCKDKDDRRKGARFIGFYIPQYETAVVRQLTDGRFYMYEPKDLKKIS